MESNKKSSLYEKASAFCLTQYSLRVDNNSHISKSEDNQRLMIKIIREHSKTHKLNPKMLECIILGPYIYDYNVDYLIKCSFVKKNNLN